VSYVHQASSNFAVDDVSVAEGDAGTSILSFTVHSGASAVTRTVKVATANETATAGTDYVALPLTKLTFAPADTAKQVNVTIKGDVSDEADETFFLNLSAPTGATIDDPQAVGTINDDGDPTPTLSIADVTKREGDDTTVFAFKAVLSEVSGFPVTFTASTADGTAVAPKDYTAIAPKTFTIPAGDKDGTINVKVTVKGDPRKEGVETFFVDYSAAVNATIVDDGRAVGTIKNDD
jgi:hypothetical protein